MATSTEKKLLRVLVSANSTEKIPILAASYQELVAECERKLRDHRIEREAIYLYTEDNTRIDEDYFSCIGNDIIVRLWTEASLVFPSIVFKVNGKNGVYQIGERNLVVTVNLSQKYTNFLDEFVENIENDEQIFSLEWSRWEEHAKVFSFGLKTKVTNALNEHLDKIEHMILRYIGKDKFNVLRLLTEKFFVEFKAMMSAVFQGCLDFRFNFLSADERMAMMQDLPKVQSMLNSILLPPDIEENFPGVEIRATINHENTSDDNVQSRQTLYIIENRNIQFLYQTETDPVAEDLKSLEGGLLPNASLNSIYRISTSSSLTSSPTIQRNKSILYTVLCVDRSSSLNGEEFSSVKKCAIEFFKELDRNARTEPHLDESVAILGFGDSLEVIDGFSFKIQDQIALMDQMQKGTSQRSGSLQVVEAVVAANILLKIYGKRREFKEPNGDFLPPRTVLISGTGLTDVTESSMKQLMDNLRRKNLCYPVYCCDFRSFGNQDHLLSSLTRYTNGRLIPKSKSSLLGAFHRLKWQQITQQVTYNTKNDDTQDIDFLFG